MRQPGRIEFFEVLMYMWIAAFAYDEFSGMTDAGMLFYQMGFWSIWNMAIIGTGVIFIGTSESIARILVQLHQILSMILSTNFS